MGKILPVLLALAGLGAGVGGGFAMRPSPQEHASANPCGEVVEASAPIIQDDTDEDAELDYIKLNNQFVIPVVTDGSVAALVVMALSLEIKSGGPELVYKREPKLRDSFLQVLFDHANTGGFDGNFTSGRNMDQLRNALREAARKILGSSLTDVLIVDVVRQDV